MILKFAENESVFQNLKYLDDKGRERERFVDVILNEENLKYSLYKTYEVEEMVNDNINGYKSVEATKINIEKNFLIGYNGQIQQISKSTKKLNEFLGFNVDEIIKSNKLNLKKNEDVFKFIEILNK